MSGGTVYKEIKSSNKQAGRKYLHTPELELISSFSGRYRDFLWLEGQCLCTVQHPPHYFPIRSRD